MGDGLLTRRGVGEEEVTGSSEGEQAKVSNKVTDRNKEFFMVQLSN